MSLGVKTDWNGVQIKFLECYLYVCFNINYTLTLPPQTQKQKGRMSPGLVARVSSPYAEVAGSLPCQGAYKKQPVSASTSGTPNLSLSLSNQ